ncbi:acetyltransferase-like isoleucine patch superfamily enzyme [Sinorhizobium terangae]|nr:acetyltransferase-like isoleucine patch superfamily enzyme [Sinorhizobium terangae]
MVIGRYCALATGVQFVMNGANHALGVFSTFPFSIFPGSWRDAFDQSAYARGCRAGRQGDAKHCCNHRRESSCAGTRPIESVDEAGCESPCPFGAVAA